MPQKNNQKKKSSPKTQVKSSSNAKNTTEKKTENPKGATRIIVQYDVGFSNSLFLRGIGAPGLNWEKGVELKNMNSDEWVWETDKPFSECEFKILINDTTFEIGDNHTIIKGSSVRINPKFPI